MSRPRTTALHMLAALCLSAGCGSGGLFARMQSGHGGELAAPNVAAEASESDGATAGSTAEEAAPPKRQWVRHRVVPRERLDDIAARYGVTKAAIIRWNKKLKKKAWIYAGQTIKVHAKIVPPPRRKVTYTVRRGDTWQKIANRNHVKVADLKAWNPKVPRAFRAGTKLTVWTNPRAVAKPKTTGGTGGAATGDAPPTFDVRAGGLSVGRPNRGRIVNGVQLPKSDLYTLRDPDHSWGSSHAVGVIQTAIATFRIDSGYTGKVVIADLSKRGGGRLRPHSSHQSGRDADIRLPKKPGAPKKSSSTKDIDWDMSWSMIKSFVDSGEVEYIFLDYNRQRLLHKAAKRAGASSAEISKAIQYPRKSRSNHGVVRHAKGHVVHVHVRVKCAKGNLRCESY